MELLKTKFDGVGEVEGTLFEQKGKTDKACLYELTDNETKVKRWEVFELKVSKESEATIGGVSVKFEEKEMYPKSNAFGVWAWCYSDYEKAILKYEKIR